MRFSWIVPIVFLSACGGENNSELHIVGGVKLPNDKTVQSAYPASIGIDSFLGSCTGTRIADNTYISAAHCFDSLDEGMSELPASIYASNSHRSIVRIKDLNLHPSYKKSTMHEDRGSDLAVFSVEFPSIHHKQAWDKFSAPAPIDYSFPALGRDVIIAGFGCEKKSFPYWDSMSECAKISDFQYIKTALNKVIRVDERYFRLKGSSSDEGITGFISNGDSGGPTYSTTGALLGVNSAGTKGMIFLEDGFGGIETIHIWLGFSDVRPWVESAIQTDQQRPAFAELDSYALIEFPNGDSYWGEVRLGKRTGKGRIEFNDGRVYEGDWLNDVRTGYGVQTWAASSNYVSYTGQWVDNLPVGQGKQIWKDGTIFEGGFLGGRYQGKGRMSYPNGDVRDGVWEQNKMQGEIILTTKAGVKWKETYQAGLRTSAVKL